MQMLKILTEVAFIIVPTTSLLKSSLTFSIVDLTLTLDVEVGVIRFETFKNIMSMFISLGEHQLKKYQFNAKLCEDVCMSVVQSMAKPIRM